MVGLPQEFAASPASGTHEQGGAQPVATVEYHKGYTLLMKKKVDLKRSLTDWERIDRMREEDIDFSDLPEVPPEDFARAVIRRGFKPITKRTQEGPEGGQGM
jgi:hypothetical protein